MPRTTTAAGSIDPYDGWLWVPGYTWAPAWVVWRGDAPERRLVPDAAGRSVPRGRTKSIATTGTGIAAISAIPTGMARASRPGSWRRGRSSRSTASRTVTTTAMPIRARRS